MDIAFQVDEFGRLICRISHAGQEATVTASDLPQATGDLKAALVDALRDGVGECYWREASGEYRWAFRTAGDLLRIAVLWSNGTLTGWEHVYWAEWPAGTFAQLVQVGLVEVEPRMNAN